jgi:hypothetical protein
MNTRPILWHIEISHYNEKARWALDLNLGWAEALASRGESERAQAEAARASALTGARLRGDRAPRGGRGREGLGSAAVMSADPDPARLIRFLGPSSSPASSFAAELLEVRYYPGDRNKSRPLSPRVVIAGLGGRGGILPPSGG